ncbi:MAG: hypothetical protein VKP57_00910 [Candidatus Sericytochromatia bacterium]|nr:hypothetical protein [Candidatus Sericytochromatia bacterium]
MRAPLAGCDVYPAQVPTWKVVLMVLVKRNILSMAAAAALVAGCNLSAAQVQQAVQQATTLLQNAGVKLEFLDENGVSQTIAAEDVESVVVDGKTLSDDEYDIVNGEVRLTRLEADDKTRQVEIRLKDVDQPITTSIVAREGAQAPSANRVAIVQDSLGGIVFQPNGDLAKLGEEQRKRDIAARVTWDLRPLALPVPPLRAGFITKDGAAQPFPQMAASWSARVVAFDVQVFNLIAGAPATASGQPVVDKSRLPGAKLWLAARRADGKFVFHGATFLPGATELKFPPTDPSAPLPLPQLLGPSHLRSETPEVFGTLDELLRAKRIPEGGNAPAPSGSGTQPAPGPQPPN